MSVNRALKHSRKIMSKNNNSDKTYSKFMLDHENSKQREFAESCFLHGILLNLSIEDISEYVFETFHSMSLEEINSFFDNSEELRGDII